jgi:hypothetical protein
VCASEIASASRDGKWYLIKQSIFDGERSGCVRAGRRHGAITLTTNRVMVWPSPDAARCSRESALFRKRRTFPALPIAETEGARDSSSIYQNGSELMKPIVRGALFAIVVLSSPLLSPSQLHQPRRDALFARQGHILRVRLLRSSCMRLRV